MALSLMGEFALSGDRGIDVFRCLDDERHRRHRYECIATVCPDTESVNGFASHARQNPAKMQAVARTFSESGFLMQDMRLGDPSSYPNSVTGVDPLQLFLYLDFFRAWQVADQAVARVEERLGGGALLQPSEISRTLKLLLDFNRIKRAAPFVAAVLPALLQAATQKSEDRWQNNGFALRIAGDLLRRSGEPEKALVCYEGALALGINPHRCGLAIQAAHDARNLEAVKRHLAAFEENWPLPETLASIKAETQKPLTGGPN